MFDRTCFIYDYSPVKQHRYYGLGDGNLNPGNTLAEILAPGFFNTVNTPIGTSGSNGLISVNDTIMVTATDQPGTLRVTAVSPTIETDPYIVEPLWVDVKQLQNQSSPGGSADIVVNDTDVMNGDRILLTITSQANPTPVETINVSDDIFEITFSADPGAFTFDYTVSRVASSY